MTSASPDAPPSSGFQALDLTTESPDWEGLRPGVRIRLLHENVTSGRRVALLRYEPGAEVPRHRHGGDEHVFVLEGAQEDENGCHSAGSHVRNPTGSHHTVSSPEGCLVLIVWDAPIEFDAVPSQVKPDLGEMP